MHNARVPVNKRWELYFKQITETENDVELEFGSALFWNRGQTACLIDGHILLKPNESHVIAVYNGGAIVHKFQFEFIDLPSDPNGADADDDVAADGLFVKKNNFLLIEMTIKKYYGNAINPE